MTKKFRLTSQSMLGKLELVLTSWLDDDGFIICEGEGSLRIGPKSTDVQMDSQTEVNDQGMYSSIRSSLTIPSFGIDEKYRRTEAGIYEFISGKTTQKIETEDQFILDHSIAMILLLNNKADLLNKYSVFTKSKIKKFRTEEIPSSGVQVFLGEKKTLIKKGTQLKVAMPPLTIQISDES